MTKGSPERAEVSVTQGDKQLSIKDAEKLAERNAMQQLQKKKGLCVHVRVPASCWACVEAYVVNAKYTIRRKCKCGHRYYDHEKRSPTECYNISRDKVACECVRFEVVK